MVEPTNSPMFMLCYIFFFFFILLLLVYLNRRFTLWMCEKCMVFLLLQIFMKGKQMFELFMNVNVDISSIFFFRFEIGI